VSKENNISVSRTNTSAIQASDSPAEAKEVTEKKANSIQEGSNNKASPKLSPELQLAFILAALFIAFIVKKLVF
jgi:hypothetical protein